MGSDDEDGTDRLAGLDLSDLEDSPADNKSEPLEVPPLIINWRELSDGEARGVWEELRSWVRWACDRYQLPEQLVPDCWWKHSYLVEELSALFASWMAFYDAADTGSGPLGWLERLANAKTRIRDVYGNTCQRGHTDPRPRSWDGDSDSSWDAWIAQSHGRGAVS